MKPGVDHMWFVLPPGSFVVGANLPWVGYGTDFGTSAWHPDGGLAARPAALARLEDAFAALERDGLSLVRVFLLCDGRSGIRYKDGLPLGLDDAFFADVDALLDAARRHHLQLMPVLLDFHLCQPYRLVSGVETGGRSHLLADPGPRSALIERVLGPILEKYADHDSIAAWDVFNEPEWCLRKPGLFWRRGLSFDSAQRFLHEVVDLVRSLTRHAVTIGSAGTWRLELVRSLSLDFYQVHWYESAGLEQLRRPVEELDLDAPVILGEFPGVLRRWSVPEVLGAARAAGYRGALVWSLLSGDDHAGYPRKVIDWARAQDP
jgi:hypothetical protein